MEQHEELELTQEEEAFLDAAWGIKKSADDSVGAVTKETSAKEATTKGIEE